MSTSRDRVRQALSHQGSDRIPVDFGATAVTGIHCRVVEAVRKHYGLSYKPVKIVDTFQMLGEVDRDLADAMGVDCIGVGGTRDIFDHDTECMHEQVTPWGQKVLVPIQLDLTQDKEIKTILRVQLCRTVVSLSMPSKGSSRLMKIN